MCAHPYSSRLTIVVWEADTEVDFLDLLLKEIFLVEEEYNGCGGKESVIADTVEQVQTFVHTVLWRGRPRRRMSFIPPLQSSAVNWAVALSYLWVSTHVHVPRDRLKFGPGFKFCAVFSIVCPYCLPSSCLHEVRST